MVKVRKLTEIDWENFEGRLKINSDGDFYILTEIDFILIDTPNVMRDAIVQFGKDCINHPDALDN